MRSIPEEYDTTFIPGFEFWSVIQAVLNPNMNIQTSKHAENAMPYLGQLRRSFHKFACAKVPLRDGSVFECLFCLIVEGIPRFFAFLLTCSDTKKTDMETVTICHVLSRSHKYLRPRRMSIGNGICDQVRSQPKEVGHGGFLLQ